MKPSNKSFAGALLVAVLLGLYFTLDPAQYFFPKCPFLWLTGWKCPGCGTQRALHQLLQGNLIEALRLNFLFVLALPYVILGLLLEYTPWGLQQTRTRSSWYGYRATVLALVFVLAFGIARNIWNF